MLIVLCVATILVFSYLFMPSRIKPIDPIAKIYDPKSTMIANMVEKTTGLLVNKSWVKGGKWYAETEIGTREVCDLLSMGRVRIF